MKPEQPRFRAWDSDAKMMANADHLMCGEPARLQEALNGELGWIPMQFIGHSDEQGVEIYDQDVVVYPNDDFGFLAVVVWGEFGWYMRGIDPNDNFSFEDTGPRELKVVGNVYENPELLEISS